MIWDRAIEAIRAAILADANLTQIFGDAVRMAAASDIPFEPKVPLLEYSVLTDTESEQWAPMIVQFDVWAPDVDRLLAGERALRRLFVPVLPRSYAGLFMLSEYVDGEVLATPDRNGFHGRGLRFKFSPLLERNNPGLASAP